MAKATAKGQRVPVLSSVTHVKDLVPDPQNARAHNERNIAAIVNAMQEVGASRSIVIDEDNVILAGNGAVEAAAEAGITKVQVVEADGETVVAVRRRGLTPEQKRRLALFDNRASDLASWDVDVLADMAAQDPVVFKGLWSEKELEILLNSATGVGSEDAGDVTIAEAFQVLVICKGESDQGTLLERLMGEGYVCRALMC